MSRRPNVLWLMSDQHNANCTGYRNNPNVKTPNLNWIAENGVDFTNAFCNNPICAPSRISFATGQYVHTHRVMGNDNSYCTDSNPYFLPFLFRCYGYQTAHIGKEHTVPTWVKDGYEYIRYTDFCDADFHDVKSNHYFKYLMDLGLEDYYEQGDRKPRPENSYDGGEPAYLPYEHSIERFTGNETLKFLDTRDASRPFFIHMSFQRPHEPVAPAKEYFDMYNPEDIVLPDSVIDYYENHFDSKPQIIKDMVNKITKNSFKDKMQLKRWLASYYALISVIDMEIGRVLKKLEEIGELENTIIIYTADHGDFAGEHGLVHKTIGIYDSIQKIPFLLKWPKGPKGEKKDDIIESVDLYPTLCELCNIPLPAEIEGKSLIKIANGEKKGKDAAFCETRKACAIRTKDFRMVFYGGEDGGELYDHRVDPEELYNQWGNPDYSDIRMRLAERLLNFTMQYAARIDDRSNKKLTEINKYTPVKLLHKHGRYWSRLKKAYDEKLIWPPEANQ